MSMFSIGRNSKVVSVGQAICIMKSCPGVLAPCSTWDLRNATSEDSIRQEKRVVRVQGCWKAHRICREARHDRICKRRCMQYDGTYNTVVYAIPYYVKYGLHSKDFPRLCRHAFLLASAIGWLQQA